MERPFRFFITTENTERVFFGRNRVVNGNVILELSKPMKARGVVITFWGESSYVEGDSESGYTTHTKNFFSFSSTLWEAKNGLKSDFIQPGVHTFPFSFTIPPDLILPPSVVFGCDHIGYMLKCVIDRPLKSNYERFLPITFIPAVDCNEVKYQDEVRQEREYVVGCLCCKSGSVIASARIPSSGWCPGEVVPILVKVENYSSVGLKNIGCRFASSSYATEYRHPPCLLGHSVPAESEMTHVFLLRIPPCPPSFSNDVGFFLSLRYTIRVMFYLEGGLQNFGIRLPITIGTIPHNSPPLFNEQRSDPDLSRPPLYPWTNVEDITAASVAVTRQSTGVPPDPGNQAQRDCWGDVKCVYFEMPSPSIPAIFTSGGHELTPLLTPGSTSATGPTTPGTLETPGEDEPTTSSFQIPKSFFKSTSDYELELRMKGIIH